MFVASNGGHLAQLLQLEPWWREHRRTWVTFDKPDARSTLVGETVVYAHHPTTRHVGNLAAQRRSWPGGSWPSTARTW